MERCSWSFRCKKKRVGIPMNSILLFLHLPFHTASFYVCCFTWERTIKRFTLNASVRRLKTTHSTKFWYWPLWRLRIYAEIVWCPCPLFFIFLFFIFLHYGQFMFMNNKCYKQHPEWLTAMIFVKEGGAIHLICPSCVVSSWEALVLIMISL